MFFSANKFINVLTRYFFHILKLIYSLVIRLTKSCGVTQSNMLSINCHCVCLVKVLSLIMKLESIMVYNCDNLEILDLYSPVCVRVLDSLNIIYHRCLL